MEVAIHESSRTLADTRSLPGDAPSPAPAQVHVPGYEILNELGRGGMGVVYRAHQVKANRVVALKMILTGEHAAPDERSRFQTEAQAVAQLQHPGIVRVYEVGEHEGRPFFSLEYCGGGSLERQLREQPLPPPQAAHLGELLARAIHHAHEQRIIHRDLKPANVLFTAQGEPRVTDFGLARKLDEVGQTATGAIVGTPSYMSPEQASGKGKELGPATDVYSLGALLYDCLTGRPPFRAATALDTLLQVIHEEPVPPRRLNANVPRDLETICLKCLHKDARQRYPTALHLADDLRRFQNGEPVQARPAGWLERGGKWVRRRPAVAALVGVSLLTLLLVLGGGLALLVLLREERNAAVAAQAKEEQLREQAEQAAAGALQLAQTRRLLDQSQRSLFNSHLWRAASMWERTPLLGHALLEDPLVCPPELRDFAWGYYHRLCSLRTTVLPYTHAVNCVATSPDGTTLATACSDATVRLWNLADGRERFTLRGHDGRVNAVAFGPKGDLLVSGGSDRKIKLWEVATGTERATLPGEGRDIQALAFSAGGKELLVGSGWQPPQFAGHPSSRFVDGEVRSWNWADGNPRTSKKLLSSGAAVLSLSASPTARLAAAGFSHDSATRLVNLDTGEVTATFKSGNGWNAATAFSPDGQTLAIGVADQVVYLWDVKGARVRSQLRGHQSEVVALAFSPDGETLASGAVDGAIHFWNPGTGKEPATLPRVRGAVRSLAFAPAGGTLAVGYQCHGGAVILDMNRQPSQTFGATEVVDLSLRGDGRLLAYATLSKGVVLRELPDGKETVLPVTTGVPAAVTLSRDGSTLAIGVNRSDPQFTSQGVEVQIRDARGIQRGVLPIKEAIHHLALTPTGRLFVRTQSARLLAWDVAGRKPLAPPAGRARATGMALSPDGVTLAIAVGKEIHLVDVVEDRDLATLGSHADVVNRLAFSGDGKILASCDGQGQVRFWDVTSGKERPGENPEVANPLCLAFTPDGLTLALGCGDRSIRLVDVETGQIRAVLTGHTREVTCLAFATDGKGLFSGSGPFRSPVWVRGGELKYWDASPPR